MLQQHVLFSIKVIFKISRCVPRIMPIIITSNKRLVWVFFLVLLYYCFKIPILYCEWKPMYFVCPKMSGSKPCCCWADYPCTAMLQVCEHPLFIPHTSMRREVCGIQEGCHRCAGWSPTRAVISPQFPRDGRMCTRPELWQFGSTMHLLSPMRSSWSCTVMPGRSGYKYLVIHE